MSSEYWKIAHSATFIHIYQWVVDAYIADFFVSDLWEKLPRSWRTALSEVEFSQLANLLSYETHGDTEKDSEKDSEISQIKCLPLSLLCFLKLAQTLPLSPVPVSEDPVHDVGFETGQYAPLESHFRTHVKAKKQYEITAAAKIINNLCYEAGCDQVLDVGAGKGHLSRVLSLSYGRQVTTVEADGCFAPQAEVYDKKAKAYIAKTSEVNVTGKTIETDQINSKNTKGEPVHVVGRIKPEITPKEFESILPRKTLQEKAEESVILTKSGDDHAKSIFCDFDTDEDHVVSVNPEDCVCLIGLHACGDLIPTLLRVFTAVPRVKAIGVVSCCYMRMSQTSQSPSTCGFPMSDYLKSFSPSPSLSWQALELACHYLPMHRRKLQENSSKLRLHAYRTGVQLMLHDKVALEQPHSVRVKVKRGDQLSWREYAIKAFSNVAPDCSLCEDEIHQYGRRVEDQWKEAAIFYCLRLLLAPVIESLVLRDRLQYLEEHDIQGVIEPIFDPAVSPRNFILKATKQ